MASSDRMRTILPSVTVTLLVLAAGIAVPGPIARAIRGVFAQATLSHTLVVAGLVAVTAVIAPRIRGSSPGRRREDAPTPPFARARRTLGSHIDQAPWVMSVTLVAAAAATVWYSLGRAITLPRIFSDEMIYANAARALAEGGALAGHGYGFVTPAIDSLAYLLTSNDVNAYRLIQAINVAVMVTSAFPAYLLARRAVSHRWALATAAMTVFVPWMGYARFVMTEAAFYPVFLFFVLMLVRALERPSLARQLALVFALGLAFATRTQAIALAGAIVCAVLLYGAAQGRIRDAVRAFAATWILFAAAGLCIAVAAGLGIWAPFGAYEVLLHGWWHPRGLVLWAASNVTSLALGLGVLVVAASPLGAATMLRRQAGREEQALAAAIVSSTLWILLTVIVLSVSPYGQGTVHERNLFYVAPLVFICAIAWATHGFPRPALLTATTAAAVVGLAVAMPTGLITSHSIDALSFKLWTQLEHGGFSSSRQMVAAAVVGVVVVVRMRSAWPLLFTVALAAVGVAAASDYRSEEPRSVTAHYAWVDRTLAPGAAATLLWIGYPEDGCPAGTPPSGLAKVALYTEYFNSQISRVGHLLGDNGARGLGTDTFALRPDGVVTSKGVPLSPEFVVTDARVDIVGSRVALLHAHDVGVVDPAKGSALALWRATPPLRLEHPEIALSHEIACAPFVKSLTR